jgi:nucleotide-binding universal stress UspA family protein
MRWLIAVDLTDGDVEDVVDHAATWIDKQGGRADLLFVDEASDHHPYIVDPTLRSTMSAHYQAWHDALAERLLALLLRLPEARRGAVAVGRGRALDEILRRAPDYDAVVVANRPASGFKRLAHGAVAERLARVIDRPLVILPRGEGPAR